MMPRTLFDWHSCPTSVVESSCAIVMYGVESLRKSADLIDLYLATWVTKRVSFGEHRDEAWVDVQLSLWDALGLAPDVAEVLASQLQLRWLGGS